MNNNSDNFDFPSDQNFGADEPDFGSGGEREFKENDGAPDMEGAETIADLGPEMFDPMWLRANGATLNEEGDILRVGAPVLVLVAAPADIASPGEEMDATLRAFGMLAWQRNRPARAGTLLEQMLHAERARRTFLEQNPFAVFWAATARTGPCRRRTSPRR